MQDNACLVERGICPTQKKALGQIRVPLTNPANENEHDIYFKLFAT